MYIVPFKSAFGCLKNVLFCTCLVFGFSVLFVFFLRFNLAFFAYDYLATLTSSTRVISVMLLASS